MDNAMYLVHHGIQGQKWGVRRFQNEDGSLTPEGRERYSDEHLIKARNMGENVKFKNAKSAIKAYNKSAKQMAKNAADFENLTAQGKYYTDITKRNPDSYVAKRSQKKFDENLDAGFKVIVKDAYARGMHDAAVKYLNDNNIKVSEFTKEVYREYGSQYDYLSTRIKYTKIKSDGSGKEVNASKREHNGTTRYATYVFN